MRLPPLGQAHNHTRLMPLVTKPCPAHTMVMVPDADRFVQALPAPNPPCGLRIGEGNLKRVATRFSIRGNMWIRC